MAHIRKRTPDRYLCGINSPNLDTSSSLSSSSRKKRTSTTTDDDDDNSNNKKTRKKTKHHHHHKHHKAHDESTTNGTKTMTNGSAPRRRPSVGKAPRDPRDRFAPLGSSSPMVNPSDGLSRPGVGTRARRSEDDSQAQSRLERMRGAVRTLLECVGEDPDREGLLDTPARYAKALLFLTSGYQVSVGDLVNNALFREGHNEMVIVKDIQLQSLCEHHLVPFIGKMHIGYIPSDTVIGLSKLPRIADMYARRLQIQERLTKDVAHAIMDILKPQGVAVVMESSHLCMVMRGVQQTTSSTITSCVLGCFERKSKTRNEFFSLVGLNSRPS
ncbi:hypothetical protein XA68_18239 [Ophiocordyceps unilateralis]|uniref:GTP cyclohydrolase 1 n=1 Tax=Ophiocordyceps unilateralis TaxID=268505 RepID=A0A2A9PRR2_OPHUN|nr:hypothetical protein XA68_18239 [Ophiocordyceps unilateralis]